MSPTGLRRTTPDIFTLIWAHPRDFEWQGPYPRIQRWHPPSHRASRALQFLNKIHVPLPKRFYSFNTLVLPPMLLRTSVSYAEAAENQIPCRVPNCRSREVKVVGQKRLPSEIVRLAPNLTSLWQRSRSEATKAPWTRLQRKIEINQSYPLIFAIFDQGPHLLHNLIPAFAKDSMGSGTRRRTPKKRSAAQKKASMQNLQRGQENQLPPPALPPRARVRPAVDQIYSEKFSICKAFTRG
ncbi:hypothetical protein C8R44DRAFT_849561 [Mycena epipterygia]|nr:hypothetical protein C8R44DRAFT_849561 [Mycena epipterygia]